MTFCNSRMFLRPIVGLQQVQRPLVDRAEPLGGSRDIAMQEILDQHQDVVFPSRSCRAARNGETSRIRMSLEFTHRPGRLPCFSHRSVSGRWNARLGLHFHRQHSEVVRVRLAGCRRGVDQATCRFVRGCDVSSCRCITSTLMVAAGHASDSTQPMARPRAGLPR